MRPLIQNFPSKPSVDSSDQNIAKVHIISKKVRLTKSCNGSANGKVISERLNNKFILCRHLAYAFLTIIHNPESLCVYEKIREREDIDTEEFALNDSFALKIDNSRRLHTP